MAPALALPAFVLAGFNPFAALGGALLAHAIWLPLILVAVAIALWPAIVLPVLKSRAGFGLVAAFVAVAAGWEARALVDRSAELRRSLAAEQAATAAAQARAVAERQAASAQRAVSEAAAAREATARSQAEALEEQVHDYEDFLAGQDRTAPAARGCALSAGDARRLRRLARP